MEEGLLMDQDRAERLDAHADVMQTGHSSGK